MKPPVALAKSYARWLAKRYDKVFAVMLPTLLDGWDRNPVHFSGRIGLRDSAYHVDWRTDASDFVNKAIRKLVHTFDEHPIDPHAVTGMGTRVAAENAKNLRVAGIPNVTRGAGIPPNDKWVVAIKVENAWIVQRESTKQELAESAAQSLASGRFRDKKVTAYETRVIPPGTITPDVGGSYLSDRKQVFRKVTDPVPIGQGISTEVRIAQFRDNNLALIKSLDSEAVDRLRALLVQAEKDAARVETLRAQIIEAFDTTRSHADLIARDQVLKLNGQITEDRQTGAGITQYTWSTSNDERVRPGHEELDGTIQSWSDPPEVDEKSGRRAHPGGDYQCRCAAIPVLP